MSDPPVPSHPPRHGSPARTLLAQALLANALDLSLRMDPDKHRGILYPPFGISFWRNGANNHFTPPVEGGRVLCSYACGGKLLRGARDLHDAMLTLSWAGTSYQGFGPNTIALRAYIPEGHPVFLCAHSAAAPLSALIERGSAPVRMEPVSDRPFITPAALPPEHRDPPSSSWKDPLAVVPVLYATPQESVLLRATSELWAVLAPSDGGGFELREVHVGAPVIAGESDSRQLGRIVMPEDALRAGHSHALIADASAMHPGRILAEQRHRDLLRERADAAMAEVSEITPDRVLYRRDGVLRFGTLTDRFTTEPRGVMVDTVDDPHLSALYLPAGALSRCTHPLFLWIAHGCVPGTQGGAEPCVGDELHDARERFLYRPLPGVIVETTPGDPPRVRVEFGHTKREREYDARCLVRLHGWGRWAMVDTYGGGVWPTTPAPAP